MTVFNLFHERVNGLHHSMRWCLGAGNECITHDKAEAQAVEANAPKHRWLLSLCAMQSMHLCAQSVPRHALVCGSPAMHLHVPLFPQRQTRAAPCDALVHGSWQRIHTPRHACNVHAYI